MATINIIGNRDTGSVHLGKVQAKVGDKLVISKGELPVGAAKEKTISYLASNRAGELIAYCRNYGSFPTGDFTVELVPQAK